MITNWKIVKARTEYAMGLKYQNRYIIFYYFKWNGEFKRCNKGGNICQGKLNMHIYFSDHRKIKEGFLLSFIFEILRQNWKEMLSIRNMGFFLLKSNRI